MSELKSKYKYIHFEKVAELPKTDRWECREKSGVVLGRVGWYGPWRQYCIQFNSGAIFHDGCLDDISDFLGQLNRAHKTKGKA